VLVKSLGKQLMRVRNIAGATILGSNKVVPILNVNDLMKSAVRLSQVTTKLTRMEAVEVGKKSILVAEDSITSRTLLKNILESAGYQVKTTVDGIDALTALHSETFDLVVSDIEMPRMNGFDLVSKIRGDKKTAELPVILVTALESREDRERGIDVGANAYIVKRSFDQSNLLEVISKLI
jgi:two-component system chemotaxis sensor kinase CheA